jgi:hypothetical protein
MLQLVYKHECHCIRREPICNVAIPVLSLQEKRSGHTMRSVL